MTEVRASDFPLIADLRDDGRATLTLNRPDAHNALNGPLIVHLSETLAALGANPRIRVVTLVAAGKAFSAGADPDWLDRMAGENPDTIRDEAAAFARVLRALMRLRQPTVAVVHGAALGGGAGLVACCDIAIASARARFAFPEVTLGLVPAMVSPYIVNAIGARHARRYMLTGESFDAQTALRLGLVHEVVPPAGLATAVEDVVGALLDGGPQAQAAVKELAIGKDEIDDPCVDETVQRFTDAFLSPDGREGVSALLAGRDPAWRSPLEW